jgi:hypothetical protein
LPDIEEFLGRKIPVAPVGLHLLAKLDPATYVPKPMTHAPPLRRGGGPRPGAGSRGRSGGPQRRRQGR